MPKKILVIEDSQETQDLLRQILEQQGYEVITASDGQEGLDKSRNEGPDLILVDLMLPRLNGYKICRLLKFDANYKTLPIIINTAHTGMNGEKIAYQVGADCFLNKPIDAEVLIRKVKEFLGET